MDWGTFLGVAAVVVGVVGLQSVWIVRALDGLTAGLERLERRFDHLEARFDHLEGRFDDVIAGGLREHGERLTRLEAGR